MSYYEQIMNLLSEFSEIRTTTWSVILPFLNAGAIL